MRSVKTSLPSLLLQQWVREKEAVLVGFGGKRVKIEVSVGVYLGSGTSGSECGAEEQSKAMRRRR